MSKVPYEKEQPVPYDVEFGHGSAKRGSVSGFGARASISGPIDEKIARAEVAEDAPEFGELGQLKAGLKQRHIQMIALCGAIGTGLFLGSGRAITRGGPAGAVLGYTIVGGLIWTVCMSIAELSAFLPLSGGVVRHAEYFCDPALSFAQGWNQVYSYLVSIPGELVAAVVLIQFWITISNAIWIAIFGALLVASNFCFVRLYGEIEFGSAILKIALIITVNIMGIVITAGGGPDHQSIGFYYWHNPGAFVQYLGITGGLGRFLGFYQTLTNAAYAYSGVENVSLAAAECRNPRQAIPKAAKRIIYRVCLFYIVTIIVVTLSVPSNDPHVLKGSGAARSPFVIAAQRAGITVMPSVINTVVITSAWSSANSSMLGGSRVLYGLARDGLAPKVFTRVSRFGIPWVCVLFIGSFCCLAFMTLSNSATLVFDWFQNLVSVASYTNWIVICGVYLRFFYALKHHGIDRSELPWASPFQPYTAWVGFISFSFLLLTNGWAVFVKGNWSVETFISSYIDIPIFATLFISYKLIKKTRWLPLEEVPVRRFLEIYKAHPETLEPPATGLQRFNILWG